MPKNYKRKDAKKLIKQHKSIWEKLDEIVNTCEQLQDKIIKLSDKMINDEIMDILEGISVDELARIHPGLKI